MKSIISIFSLIILFGVVVSSPDYYWRPFDGTIPADALVGVSGAKPTYIGNVPIFGGGLYVGELHPGVKAITVTGFPDSGGKVHVKTGYIQILCTRSPSLFQWMPTTAGTLHQLPYHLVEAGYEYNILGALGVGRVYYNNQLTIGKISGYHYSYYDELFITNGRQELAYSAYEALVYKGKI